MTASPTEQIASPLSRIEGLTAQGRAKMGVLLQVLLDAFVSDGVFIEMNEQGAHRLSATIAQCFLNLPGTHGFTWPAVKMNLRGQCFALNVEEQERLEVIRVTRVMPDGPERIVFEGGAWQ